MGGEGGATVWRHCKAAAWRQCRQGEQGKLGYAPQLSLGDVDAVEKVLKTVKWAGKKRSRKKADVSEMVQRPGGHVQ